MGNEVEGSKHRNQTNVDLTAEMVSEFVLQVSCSQMTNLMPRSFPVSSRVVLVEFGIVRTQPEHIEAIEVIDLRSLLYGEVAGFLEQRNESSLVLSFRGVLLETGILEDVDQGTVLQLAGSALG